MQNFSNEFKNKNIIITGGSRGIGKTLVEKFIELGANVITINRTKTFDLKTNKIIEINADINDNKTIKHSLNKLFDSGLKVDILINNAGILIPGKIMDTSLNIWRETVETNILASIELSKLVARHMIDNHSEGNIIFAGSYAANLPSYSAGVYAASKAMVISITKSLAAELAPYKIRVNAYSPGVVLTEMTKKNFKENKAEILNQISMNRLGELDEVANSIIFLASNNSSYITGHNLKIDGGKLSIQNPSKAYD